METRHMQIHTRKRDQKKTMYKIKNKKYFN